MSQGFSPLNEGVGEVDDPNEGVGEVDDLDEVVGEADNPTRE